MEFSFFKIIYNIIFFENKSFVFGGEIANRVCLFLLRTGSSYGAIRVKVKGIIRGGGLSRLAPAPPDSDRGLAHVGQTALSY